MASRNAIITLTVADLPQFKEAYAELLGLVDDLRDHGGPCWYDHDGSCLPHGWNRTEPVCPHARAAKLFAPAEPGTPKGR